MSATTTIRDNIFTHIQNELQEEGVFLLHSGVAIDPAKKSNPHAVLDFRMIAGKQTAINKDHEGKGRHTEYAILRIEVKFAADESVDVVDEKSDLIKSVVRNYKPNDGSEYTNIGRFDDGLVGGWKQSTITADVQFDVYE